MVKGRMLTKWAALFGLKRRWFGFESDRQLRQRLINLISGLR